VFRGFFTSSLDPASHFLVLGVRRSHIIQDTIVQLQNFPERDLKKPLKVMFAGEEGIDEGGVQKEFFQVSLSIRAVLVHFYNLQACACQQIITRELFDVNFGMFIITEETQDFWFNQSSLDDMMGVRRYLVSLSIENFMPDTLRFCRNSSWLEHCWGSQFTMA
jgi:hypothetical protein